MIPKIYWNYVNVVHVIIVIHAITYAKRNVTCVTITSYTQNHVSYVCTTYVKLVPTPTMYAKTVEVGYFRNYQDL